MHGWGLYPVVRGERVRVRDGSELEKLAREAGPPLPQGSCRSYGDACLHDRVASMLGLDRIVEFDEREGTLRAEAGITIDEILRVAVPRGWFLPVTPGTRFVTLGGCISADVHGKNHHVDGSFGSYVEGIDLVVAGGARHSCSRTESPDLFRAVVGGMGLLGYIREATIRLVRVPSAFVRRRTIAAGGLEEVDRILRETERGHRYSVAWIDGLARGASLGRGIVFAADPARPEEAPTRDPFDRRIRRSVTVPARFPGWFLGRGSLRAFNAAYFRRGRRRAGETVVPLDPFFYPLDALGHWNRMYGRRGFLQYQVALPGDSRIDVIRELLERLALLPGGAFLAVLKNLGDPGADAGCLSFPVRGSTLAVDVPLRAGVIPRLRELDRVVLEAGGRVYLAKDAVLEREVFEGMYPGLAEFRRLKSIHDPGNRFRSRLSDRLGIT
jgi:FAD/FMN-containing dehydrogenase